MVLNMNSNYQELMQKKRLYAIWTGVIYHGNKLLPNVHEFVCWLQENNKKFLFLTKQQ